MAFICIINKNRLLAVPSLTNPLTVICCNDWIIGKEWEVTSKCLFSSCGSQILDLRSSIYLSSVNFRKLQESSDTGKDWGSRMDYIGLFLSLFTLPSTNREKTRCWMVRSTWWSDKPSLPLWLRNGVEGVSGGMTRTATSLTFLSDPSFTSLRSSNLSNPQTRNGKGERCRVQRGQGEAIKWQN